VLSSEDKYYRLNLSVENEEYTFAAELEELTDYTPGDEPQFAVADIEAYAKKGDENKPASDDDDKDTDEKKCPECGKPVSECECDHDDENKKKKYTLEEIPEYVELQARYAQLEADFNEMKTAKEDLEVQIAPLAQFKRDAEKKDKEAMINSFYMLSEEDKKEVVENINNYSVDEIESKLAVICVRNKVSFALEDEVGKEEPTIFNLNEVETVDSGCPGWIKAAEAVKASKNK
jgi:hypothetical protein